MNYVVALASLILFAGGFRLARISTISSEALREAREAFAQMADRNLSEVDKERIARGASTALFGRFFRITLLTAVALIAPALVIALAAGTGATDHAAIESALFSPWLIGAAFLLIGMEFWFRR